MTTNITSKSLKERVLEKQTSETATINFTAPIFKIMKVGDFLKNYYPYLYNRGDNEDKANKERARDIADSIREENTFWLAISQPIVVDPKSLIIVDGNTRCEAFRILHEEYGYDFEIGVSILNIPAGLKFCKVVQKFNNCQKGWPLNSYVNNFVKEGYADYRRLKEMTEALGRFFYEDGQYRWRYASALSGKPQQAALREGTYHLSADEMKKQLAFGEDVKKIWEASGCPKVSTWVESFILALYEIKEGFGRNYNVNTWAEKFKKDGGEIFKGYLSKQLWKEAINELLTR